MTTDLAFTSQSLLLSSAMIFGFIALTIGLFRLYFKRLSNTPFKEKIPAGRNKYKAVDIHQFRPTFIGLSLALMLGITIVAFNWTTYDHEIDLSDYSLELAEDIEIEPPRSATPPPPPPPPPPPVIQEIPNELIIEEDEMVFVDQSVEVETEVYHPDPVVRKEAVPPPPPPPPPSPQAEKVAEIFKIVEQMPRFPGCEDLSGNDDEKKACSDKKLMEFIYKNINYPGMARENNIQGTVVLQFVVEKDGSITEAKVVRDIGGGCGEEAIRILTLMQNMPQKWTPGRQIGRPVRVMFNLPIRFKLKDV